MKKIITMISIMILMLTTNVYAINIAEAGETVNQIGDYDSTRIVAGNTVNSKANIDGLSIIAGNEITLEGSAPYGFYAGNIITINQKIEKDLFIAGNSITIDNDSQIGRDIFIAGNTVKIKTNINRDLRVGGTKVDISGITIKGDAYIEAEQIILDEETTIEGKLTYPEESNIIGLDKAKVEKIETTKYEKIVIEYTIMDRVRNFIISTLASIVTLIALFYIIPSSKEKLDNTELTPENIIKKIGIGLLALIAVPFIALISMFTGVLTPLALITLVVYIIGIYLSSLLIYYIVGKEITKKLNKENKYLAIIIGVISVKIIRYIPVIGGIVGALSLFYGLGLIFKFVKKSR